MHNPIKQFDSTFNEVIDRLKVFAIDTLTYDIRRFVYRLTFKQVFKYVVAGMFLTLIPTLVILGVLAAVYSGYLFYHGSDAYLLWSIFAVTGFVTACLFYYFSSKFVFSRSTRMIKLPEATNPAEVFVSKIILELKNEQLRMMNGYPKH